MKLLRISIVAIAFLIMGNLTAAIGQIPSERGSMMNGGMMRAGTQSDRSFIEMMIPHHQGAVKMADIILKKTKRPELRQLATTIKQEQSREIDRMKAWYRQWYKTSVPTVSRSGGMGMMSSGGMANMMAAQVQSLETATDADRAFLEEMIPHHKMALMMTSHIVDSDRPELRTLAQNILRTQAAEIEKMRQYDRAWYR